jgi:hypothetical protein
VANGHKTGTEPLTEHGFTEYSLSEYSEDGVDLTLISWFLSLTPAERLQYLQRQVKAILAIRRLNAR